MSDDHGMPELDLRGELARIDRDRAETQKVFAEIRRLDDERSITTERLIAEREKFIAERQKLLAEALKFGRDRWLAPVTAVGAGIGSGIGAFAIVWRLLHG